MSGSRIDKEPTPEIIQAMVYENYTEVMKYIAAQVAQGVSEEVAKVDVLHILEHEYRKQQGLISEDE